MKIFFASHSSELAGAEQSLLRLVSAAARRGHHGMVSVPRTGPLINMLQNDSASFSVVRTPTHMWMGRRTYGLVGLLRLLQCLIDTVGFVRKFRTSGIDVVVVNSAVIPSPLLAAFICRIPSVLIVRETILTNPMLRTPLPRTLIRWSSFQWASQVVTVSAYVAKQFRFASTVVNPQVDPAFFVKDELSYMNNPKSEDKLDAVMLGYFTPEKGQLDAIAAIKNLKMRGVQVNLDIYGSGSKTYLDRMLSAIEDGDMAGQISVHPPSSSAREILQAADISLVCSKNEAFGKVTAESVLVGTPVVGYDLGGTAEILRAGGGVLVEATPEALGDAIATLAADRSLLLRYSMECGESRLHRSLKSTADDLIALVERTSNEV